MLGIHHVPKNIGQGYQSYKIVTLYDRKAADFLLRHQLGGLFYRRIGRDRNNGMAHDLPDAEALEQVLLLFAFESQHNTHCRAEEIPLAQDARDSAILYDRNVPYAA